MDKNWHPQFSFSRKNTITTLSAPIYIKFYPTFRCTNNCIFCFIGERFTQGNQYTEMDKEDIDRFINILVKLKIFRFSILGGEPFLYPHLDYLLFKLHKNNIYITIATNGTMLDTKIINLVKKFNVNLGVSLHSHISQIHNELVRPNRNAWQKINEFIDYLTKINCSFRVATVVCEKNKDQIEDFIKFIVSKGAKLLELIYPLPTGNMRKNKNLGISLKEYLNLFKKTEKIAAKHNLKIHPDCHYSFFLPNKTFTFNNPLAKILYGCSIGKTKLDILPNGDIYPCSFFIHEKKWLIGNILKDDVKVLWEKSPILNKFRNRTVSLKCGKCKFSEICQGGCPGARYLEFGNIECKNKNSIPDPNCKDFCKEKL